MNGELFAPAETNPLHVQCQPNNAPTDLAIFAMRL